MIYKFNSDMLIYEKVSFRKPIAFFVSLLGMVFLTAFTIGTTQSTERIVTEFTEAEAIVLINESDPFSKEAMVQMLKELNVKFPYIVLAQSTIETGHWTSGIFLENHNLFGMKQARSRVTTALGTNRNHAYYNHWRESVYDYAFYQSRYLGKIKSEKEYFAYLNSSYAEDPNYIKKIKSTIEKEKLKELFK